MEVCAVALMSREMEEEQEQQIQGTCLEQRSKYSSIKSNQRKACKG